jgi:hypothetical protein
MTNTGRNLKVWGALVTDPTGRGEVPTGYHACVTWEPLSVVEEASLFPQFLELARPAQVVGGREWPAAEGLLLLATAALRWWLGTAASAFPPIESLGN